MTDNELRKFVVDYKPSPKVLQTMANIQVLDLVGPSATGKTTIMKVLVEGLVSVRFILDETKARTAAEENYQKLLKLLNKSSNL